MEATLRNGALPLAFAALLGIAMSSMVLPYPAHAAVALLLIVIATMLVRMHITALAREHRREIEREAEERAADLRRSDVELQRLKVAVDSHAIVSITDVDGTIIYVNDKFCEISGYARDELLNQNHRIIKSGAHPARWYEDLWSTIARGELWTGDVCNRRKDGSHYWVRSTILPILDEEGIPFQYVSVRTDITPLKELEAALRKQHEELETILDTVPAMIWFKDTRNRILRANRVAAETVGLTPQQMEGRETAEIYPEEAQRYYRDDLEVIREGKPKLKIIEPLPLPNGDRCWVRTDKIPYRDECGNIVGVLVFALDVSERVQAEERLRVSEERFRRSQIFSNIGTWDWNIQTGEVYWSEGAPPLFGFEAGEAEITYDIFLASVHPDDRKFVVESINACVERGAEYNIEHRVVWPDGTVRWLLERGDVVRTDDGAPLRMMGLVQDITRRKLAEEALRDSEEIFRQTADAAQDAILILDNDGNISFCNRGAEQIFGYARAQVLGRPLHELMVPERFRRAHQAGFERFRSDGEGKVVGRTFDLVAYSYSRGEFPAEVSVSAVKIKGLWHAIGILRDISERKRAEQELIKAKEAAERADRAKSEFLSSMSHELRTPMNAILGFAQLLEYDHALDTSHRESVVEIRKAGEHLLKLINDVLDLASIEAGRLELTLEPVQVAAIIGECVTLARPLADARGLSMEALAMCSCEDCWVRADKVRLKQVLLNLLVNAIKYNRRGGRVHVHCSSPAPGRVRISVTDTGIGISREQLPQLFRPFNRLGAERSDVEGTGIGLVITRRLVEFMGGEIGLESTPGEGSTFWCAFSTVAAPPTAHQERRDLSDAPASPGSLSRQYKLLYVEDHPANQRLVASLVAHWPNFTIASALSAEEGLELARTQRPDVILMDINLPGMNGYRALDALRADARTRAIPIIAISADAASKDTAVASAAGFSSYLTKPVNLRELAASIGGVLGGEAPDVPQPCGAQASAGETEKVDHARWRELQELMGEGFLSLAEIFVSDVPARLGQVEDALAQGDFETARRAAHALKGSSANIGATRLSQRAKELEWACRGADAPSARQLLASVRAEFDSARMALHSYSQSGI